MPENKKNRYGFVFEYGRDWMVLLCENGVNKEYFNSAEDSWDRAIEYFNLFLENGGNKYEYKLNDYEDVEAIDVFKLKDEQVCELESFAV